MMVERKVAMTGERNSKIVCGAWVIRGARVPGQAVVDNADDGFTAEQIVAEIIYPNLPLEPTRRVIAFAIRAHV